ncbi:LOW QUALITY PROTEIN: hypothetical protein Cgig2_034052 [Carnegiea gigantea]|uniref:DNA-directed RNA polymerase n=1 Tax=Carnegiea gigantea TaxID=171969 RepID=A0A9Q1KKB1_9CARY|nr:LOW QUALITY PROTEIN: hypothetical protein Cgig2_034052 [Carnegiea gigantea]
MEDRKVGRRKDVFMPALPPELGLTIQIDRVLFQKNILANLLTSRSMPEELVIYLEKLVQEAIDALFDNGIHRQLMRDDHNKVHWSFLDVKKEDFMGLGKHVDYSSYYVIIVGPSLSLHRCGLPPEIAMELFQTFLLIRQHLVSILGVAKSEIWEKELVLWKILPKFMQGHSKDVLFVYTHYFVSDSMQTLMGIKRLFMLSLETQAEARLLMFSQVNLLSPTIGDPISIPTYAY